MTKREKIILAVVIITLVIITLIHPQVWVELP